MPDFTISNELPNVQKLASLIHNKTCHWNHTDGCSWCYEEWDEIPLGWAKSEHIKIAEKMLKKYDFETAEYIIQCLK